MSIWFIIFPMHNLPRKSGWKLNSNLFGHIVKINHCSRWYRCVTHICLWLHTCHADCVLAWRNAIKQFSGVKTLYKTPIKEKKMCMGICEYLLKSISSFYYMNNNLVNWCEPVQLIAPYKVSINNIFLYGVCMEKLGKAYMKVIGQGSTRIYTFMCSTSSCKPLLRVWMR